jgi:hypothetical protein
MKPHSQMMVPELFGGFIHLLLGELNVAGSAKQIKYR